MSIVARGNHGGYTRYGSGESNPTKEYYLESICSALGGRAAERVFDYGLTHGAAGTEAAGAATAGTGAAAGGIGMLKIGLIAFAAVAIVGLGAFAAAQIGSGSAELQEPPAIEEVIDQEEPEAPEEDSQLADGTEDSEGEDSQPVEEAEEEASISYIFSHMPVAAYEVTGLGVGRVESVNEGEIYYELGDYYFNAPLVRLTPGENTFVLFCIRGDVEVRDVDEWGGYVTIGATIHSPSGSSQWEAITYACMEIDPQTLGDFSTLERHDTGDYYVYDEETYDGRILSDVDPWLKWIEFAEIYHPDSPQDDTIYAIAVEAYYYGDDYDEIDNFVARMVEAFEDLGATAVKEIPVEEALERCNVVVSEGDAN